jgi:hypothetical protein
MPRDASGNYVLPPQNPVAAGTVITSDWANSTMSDIANELTNSLSRNGLGGMLAPLTFANGTLTEPSIAFTTETTLGFYKPSAATISCTKNFTVIGDLTATNGSIDCGTF